MRNLIAKVLRMVLKVVEPKKEVRTVEEYCTITTNDEVTRGTSVHETHIAKVTDINKLEHQALADFIKEGVEQISAELFVKGYKELPTILEQHDVKVVQAYHLSQLCQLGQYNQEEDNLDQYNKEQLVKMIIDTNMLQFRQRMIEQGKAQCSEKQIELIKELSAKAKVQYKTPSDKFQASDIIADLKAKLGIKTESGASESQIRVINNLCKKLNKNLAIQEIAVDVKSASKLIGELLEEAKTHPELNVTTNASKEQIDYVKRLLNMQKKRWTQKKEAQYSAMTSSEISKVIRELKDECVAQGLINTKATQGQIDYIISLGKRLNKTYVLEKLKETESTEATKIIDMLQREQLYVLYIGSGNKITKKEIMDMTIEVVRELTKQIQLERRTDDYTKGADGYDSQQRAL